MSKPVSLDQLATVIRSKNAGPYVTTLDLIFPDRATFSRVKEAGVLTKQLVAELYQVPLSYVQGIYFHEPALAIKVSIMKTVPAGDVFCPDVTGAQQHVPLLSITIP